MVVEVVVVVAVAMVVVIVVVVVVYIYEFIDTEYYVVGYQGAWSPLGSHDGPQ